MIGIMETDSKSKESQRLLSFTNWPSSSPIFPTILASHGFYFTGVREEVRCFSCGCLLKGLTQDDDIETEHRKVSPSCPLVTGSDAHNVPMEQNGALERQGRELMACYQGRDAPQVHLDRLYTGPNAIRPTDNLTINPTRPELTGSSRPALCKEEERLKTFRSWPAGNIINPKDLAKAGFFYLGNHDRVQCQFCGGILLHWEPIDEAMSEHRRYFPDCPFICQMDVGNVPIETPTDRPHSTYEEPRSLDRHSGIDYYVDPREVKARLDTPIVRVVLEWGYSRELVKQCILHRLRTHGNDFPSAETLLDAVRLTEVGEFQQMDERNESQKLENQGRKEQSRMTFVNDIDPGGLPITSEEAEALKQENQAMKDSKTCKVCMDEEIDTVFLPCGHLVCCSSCALALRKCPICREIIRGCVRTNLSE